jgi:lysophospholipase L1-like esterase
MRRTRLTILGAAVVALGAVIGLAVWHRGKASSSSPLPRSRVSLVGDSLNVGVEPSLRELLPGWAMSTDDVVGRPTETGLERLRAEASSLAPYVVVSLGTNDAVTAVDAFRSAVDEALALAGAHRCVVWATIHRDGTAYDPFNEVLRAASDRNRNLRVVDWEAMVERSPSFLAGDGIHGSPNGYTARASAIVAAMRACHDAGIGT